VTEREARRGGRGPRGDGCAVLAATLGNAFVVVGFALFFWGTLVVAVALEVLVGPPPSTPPGAPDASDVGATPGRLVA
jgi:hypothetical protein